MPPNEAERLDTLRGYQISGQRSRAGLCRSHPSGCHHLRLSHLPIPLVEEDRQWFKSRQGIDAAETPRESAFCAHAIMTLETMVIPDATHDPRFANNPLVLGEIPTCAFTPAPFCERWTATTSAPGV